VVKRPGRGTDRSSGGDGVRTVLEVVAARHTGGGGYAAVGESDTCVESENVTGRKRAAELAGSITFFDACHEPGKLLKSCDGRDISRVGNSLCRFLAQALENNRVTDEVEECHDGSPFGSLDASTDHAGCLVYNLSSASSCAGRSESISSMKIVPYARSSLPDTLLLWMYWI
jgi:hypothetical protein